MQQRVGKGKKKKNRRSVRVGGRASVIQAADNTAALKATTTSNLHRTGKHFRDRERQTDRQTDRETDRETERHCCAIKK